MQAKPKNTVFLQKKKNLKMQPTLASPPPLSFKTTQEIFCFPNRYVPKGKGKVAILYV